MCFISTRIIFYNRPWPGHTRVHHLLIIIILLIGLKIDERNGIGSNGRADGKPAPTPAQARTNASRAPRGLSPTAALARLKKPRIDDVAAAVQVATARGVEQPSPGSMESSTQRSEDRGVGGKERKRRSVGDACATGEENDFSR